MGSDRVTTASAALAELKNPNPFLTMRVADLLGFFEANAALFKDRDKPGDPATFFNPGIYDEE